MMDFGRESYDLDAGRLASSGVIQGPWRAPLRRRAEVWIANALLISGAFATAVVGGWLIEKGGEWIMLWWMGS